MTAKARWLRRAAWLCATLVIALGALTARMVVDGEAELALSDAAFDEGDLRRATLHARRAALAYAPGAPHVRRAFARLEAIAVGAEAAGEPRAAERAWQAMREAALEARHLWVPNAAELARANAALARLRTSREPHSATDGGSPSSGRAAFDELDRIPGTAPLWGVLLVASAALFGAGIVVTARRAVAADGSVHLSRAKLGIALAAVGVALWTLAVVRA